MKIVASIVVLSLMLSNLCAQTTDSTGKKKAPWFVERFRLTAGFFVPVNNTDVQVNVQGGSAGTDIDFEKDLGMDKAQFTFLAGFQWRISRRSRINFSYYNIPRSSTHTIAKDITFRDTVYHANSTVSSFFNTAIYQISYGYAIVAKPDFELGVLIGTHLVGGKVGLSLVNSGGRNASASTDFGFTAPLPDLGLWGGYAFNKRWAATLDIDYLSLTIGDVKGSIFAYNLLVMYKLMDQLDLSFGFSGLNFKVDVVKEKADGHFKWGYNGPALGATFSFGKKSWTH